MFVFRNGSEKRWPKSDSFHYPDRPLMEEAFANEAGVSTSSFPEYNGIVVQRCVLRRCSRALGRYE